MRLMVRVCCVGAIYVVYVVVIFVVLSIMSMGFVVNLVVLMFR